jgi:hypothetical protein
LLAWRKAGDLPEREDTAEYRMKRLISEKISEDERKAYREAWRKRWTT